MRNDRDNKIEQIGKLRQGTRTDEKTEDKSGKEVHGHTYAFLLGLEEHAFMIKTQNEDATDNKRTLLTGHTVAQNGRSIGDA